MIPHNRVTFTREQRDAVDRVLASGHVAQGPEVAALEDDYRLYAGRKHAVAVASGTAALRLSFLALRDLKPIVPAYSCVALANAAHFYHSEIGIADCLPNTWTIAPDDLGSEPRASVVVAVNTFGVKSDIMRLKAAAGAVIEDCTHGFGNHRSDVEVLSLYPTKLFGAAGGGMILTDEDDIAEFCRDMRDYDDKSACAWRLNDKLTDLQAAAARAKLACIDKSLSDREYLAQRYQHLLAHAAGSNLLALPPSGERSWYRFVVHTALQAEPVCAELKRLGVCAERPVEWWADGPRSDQPLSERAYLHNVSLPLYPGMTGREVDLVAHELAAHLKKG